MEIMQMSEEKIVWEMILAKGALRYSLIETEEIIEDEKCKTYGVSIISDLFEKREECKVLGITDEKERAEEFLKMLSDNVVMPWCLEELAEDYIGD